MRVLASVAVIALAACTSPDPLPFAVDGAPGDLVVVATVADDQITSQIATRWEAAPIVSVEDDEALHVWLLRAGTLVDTTGAPLDADRLDTVAVRPAEDGACRGATATSPQVIYAGDVCPLPDFAEHFAEPPDAPPPALTLVWPGLTTCARGANDVPGPTTWTLEGPDPDFWPHAVYAATPDGTVAAFGAQHAVVTSGPALTAVPFGGEVLAAVGVGDGFVVSSGNEQVELRGELTEFGADLTVRRGPRDLGFRAERLRRHGDHLIVVGEGSGARQPKARVCDSAVDVCSDLNPDELAFLGRALRDAVALDDGSLLAIGDHGILHVDRIPAPEEVVGVQTETLGGSAANGVLTTATGTIAWRAYRKVFEGRDEEFTRAYGLRRVEQLDDGRLLHCATGPETLVLVGDTETLAIVARVSGTCSGIATEPNGALRVTTDTGASVVVGDTVETTERLEYPETGALAYLDTVDGVTIGARPDGAFFVRSGDAFEPRYVPSEPLLGPPVVMHERGDTFALFGDGDVAVFGGPNRTLTVTGTIVAAAPAGTDLAVIVRHDDGLTVRSTDGTRWLDEATRLDGVRDVRDFAVVDSGALVIADTNGRLFVHDGATHPVAIEWDDPKTDPAEIAPGQPFGCGASAGPDDVLRAVGAWAGTAWAAGCDRALLRVNVYANPPVATRVAFPAATVNTPSFTALVATCPDELLLGSGADGARDPRVWRFARCDGAPCARDADRFVRPPATDENELGGVTDLASAGGRTLVLHERGVHFLGRDALYRIEDPPHRAAFLPDGTAVFTTFAGRLFVGRSE